MTLTFASHLPTKMMIVSIIFICKSFLSHLKYINKNPSLIFLLDTSTHRHKLEMTNIHLSMAMTQQLQNTKFIYIQRDPSGLKIFNIDIKL